MSSDDSTRTATTTARSTAPLFQPYRIGSLSLKNRFAMAPMTRRFSPDGVITDRNVAYYRRRAESGVGLIITEGTWIPHPVAGNGTTVPRFYGEDALEGWRKVLEAVHQAGGRIFPQLWHQGLMRPPNTGFHPELPSVSPSGIRAPGISIGDPMSQREIDALIEAYATAAGTAHRMGFDGIEIHGAHGYLAHQFLWSGTNQRTDRYGGDLSARTHFAVELIQECRRRTAPDFPISLRLSQWRTQEYTIRLAETVEEWAQMIEPLVDAGLDIIHISTRRYWEPGFDGSDLSLAAWTRQISGKTVITVGSVGLDKIYMPPMREFAAPTNINRLLELFDRGFFDIAAVGRAMLADWDWTDKVRRGAFAELAPYLENQRDTLY